MEVLDIWAKQGEVPGLVESDRWDSESDCTELGDYQANQVDPWLDADALALGNFLHVPHDRLAFL